MTSRRDQVLRRPKGQCPFRGFSVILKLGGMRGSRLADRVASQATLCKPSANEAPYSRDQSLLAPRCLRSYLQPTHSAKLGQRNSCHPHTTGLLATTILSNSQASVRMVVSFVSPQMLQDSFRRTPTGIKTFSFTTGCSNERPEYQLHQTALRQTTIAGQVRRSQTASGHWPQSAEMGGSSPSPRRPLTSFPMIPMAHQMYSYTT